MFSSCLSKVLALGVCTQVVFAAPGQCPANKLEVQTSSGVVYGTINGTTPAVRAFLGIPFAQAPVGNLRWSPPVGLNDTGNVIDATQFSPSCPQFESAIKSVYNQDVREFFVNGPTGEDCLTLSVWTPAYPTSASLPVFIWIYGGGFQTGGSSVPYQNPAKWVQRTQSHIVVSIQYRLGIFGFPNAAGLTSQNLGLLDQRLAMEWVRTNIGSFGGDPSQMVLWGQSAGAVSVDMQNFAYPSDPIVKGFIANSGSALFDLNSADTSRSNFTFVAHQFNCTSADPTVQVDCMRTIPSASVESFLKAYSDSNTTPSLSFNPTPDNITVFSNYTSRYLSDQLSPYPAILGTNLNEGASLIAYPTSPSTSGPNTTLATITTLSLLCSSSRSSTLRTSTSPSRKTYRYQYRGNFTNISPRPWMGAYHSSELPLIFGTDADARGSATDFEVATSHAMQDLWLKFAQDPENGLENAGWRDFADGNIEIFGDPGGTAVEEVDVQSVDAVCG